VDTGARLITVHKLVYKLESELAGALHAAGAAWHRRGAPETSIASSHAATERKNLACTMHDCLIMWLYLLPAGMDPR